MQLAPFNDNFLSQQQTLERQGKWYYLIQLNNRIKWKIILTKKFKVKRPEERPQGQNLTMLQHAQFFF